MIFETKKELNFFDGFLFLFNFIIAIALLLSYLAPVADPQKAWLIAMLGLIYPFLLIINVIFIVYWLLRFRLFALISAACILCGVNVMIESFEFHNRDVNSKRSFANIRMMTYNVRGFVGSAPSKQTIDPIVSLIGQQHPDVLNLEEFAINVDDQRKIYASLTKIMSPGHYHFKAYDYTPYDSSGVVIFSKYPILNSGEVLPPVDTTKTQAIFADLKKENQVFRVYCIHLQSTHFNDDDHAYLKKLANSGKVSFHQIKDVARKLQQAFINRSYQVAAIKKHMDNCPYPYIIAGDFNDTPNSYAVNTIGKGLKNAFIEKGDGLGITYYGDFPNVHIDYIFTSHQFDVINYNRIEKKISDHYPIASDLYLAPKAPIK